jgi:hypothetical protein
MAEETRTAEEIMATWNKPPVDSGYELTVGVEVPDGDTRATAALGSVPSGGEETDQSYEDMTVAELKAEIDRRNSDPDREEALSKSGNKDDLIATLEEDDDSADE